MYYFERCLISSVYVWSWISKLSDLSLKYDDGNDDDNDAFNFGHKAWKFVFTRATWLHGVLLVIALLSIQYKAGIVSASFEI